MATHLMVDSQAAHDPCDTFDPALWLQALTTIGGGYALAAGRRLYLLVEQCDAEDLTGLMSQVIGQPERQEAIRCTIEQRHFGKAA